MKISQCRSCKSKNIKKAFDLGLQSLTGVFPKTKESTQQRISPGKGRFPFPYKIIPVHPDNKHRNQDQRCHEGNKG